VTGLVAIVEERVVFPLRYDALCLDDLAVAHLLDRRPAVDGAIRLTFLVDVAALPDEAVFLAYVLRGAFFLV
jgi:hypothetical protein